MVSQPQTVAITYRQPPTTCFVSEAAAKAAGYVPDPNPARATKSADGTCPSENPVKGFTDAQGRRQLYLAPGEPGYAAQRATDCFSDTGLAEYYGFKPATGVAPGASARPSAAPSSSARPSAAPSILIAPVSLDFGVVAIGGASAPRTLTLTNHSDQAIQVRTIEPRVEWAQASQFGIKFDGCGATEVAPGGTCTFTVTFRPAGIAGAHAATIVVPTGAGPSNVAAPTGRAW